MLRKLLIALGVLGAVLLVATAGLLLYARHTVTRSYDVPAPRIRRAKDPSAIARGEVLARTACAGCHADPATGRFTGSKLDFPAFFGEFYASNITADRSAGIGAMSDEMIARVIRVGIKHEGRLAAMPRLPDLSDDDVAAILGFLRSADPHLAPFSTRQPPSRFTLLGSLLVTFLFPAYPEAARVGIARPEKGPTADYGRYLANNVFDCFECHTDGFGRGKLREPGLYGGRLFPGGDPAGRKIYAPNLTPHASGLEKWTYVGFVRAMRTGITPDARVLQPPMMRLRLLDDVDLEAIWVYLRTLPPVNRANPLREVKVHAAGTPPELFVRLGCAGCHAAGQRYADALAGCKDKPLGDVALWIRKAHELKPDTQMPSYESLIDESTATLLAAWVQATAARGPISVASPGE